MPERDVMIRTAELRSGAVVGRAPVQSAAVAHGASVGRVVQLNVSSGGVPKRPVPGAYVGELGLEGDFHDSPTHGGPLRAVSLLAVEAIGRVAADGHPIAPGTTGENVTTEAIELATLPMGTRLAVGREVVLALTQHVTPCTTIAGSFTDGHYERLSVKRHPSDARVYASVEREGTIRPGDEIRVLD
jgi:MOSC domain-containing protein YiiM